MKPKYRNEFVEYIKELLEGHIDISVRPMFGGFGLYSNKQMFGLIADNELYFKADPAASKVFQELGSDPFTYERNGKTIAMSYWKVPDEVLENTKLLKQWIDLASQSSRASKSKQKGGRV